MDKKLLETRKKFYSENSSIYWILSVFISLILMLCSALDLLIPSMMILTFPFIFFPLLFSCFFNLLSVKAGVTLTPSNMFKLAGRYFMPPNNGSFRLLTNFLKAVLAEIIAIFVLSAVLNVCFQSHYGDAFSNSLQEMIDITYSGDTDKLTNFLSADSLALKFLYALSGLSFSIGTVVFLFGIIYSSLSIFLRLNLPKTSSMFVTNIFNKFLKENRNQYRKDIWLLFWPMILLFIVGIAAGYAVIMIFDIEPAYSNVLTSIFGAAFMIPSIPFYFSGVEALFGKYENQFKSVSSDITKQALERLKASAELSEEDRQKIEELLNGKNSPFKEDAIDNPVDEEESEEEQENETNDDDQFGQ